MLVRFTEKLINRTVYDIPDTFINDQLLKQQVNTVAELNELLVIDDWIEHNNYDASIGAVKNEIEALDGDAQWYEGLPL